MDGDFGKLNHLTLVICTPWLSNPAGMFETVMIVLDIF